MISESDLMASEPQKQIRIICMVMSSPINDFSNAKSINATWGKRCNTLLFISNKKGLLIILPYTK